MISSEVEAAIERLWRAEGIHCIGTIARMVDTHRDSVERVLAKAELVERKGDSQEQRKKRPRMVDPYIPVIDETLRRYPKICASRIFCMLKERGYAGTSSSVIRDVVRARRPAPPQEAFLKLSMLPGEQAQVDWGFFGDAGPQYPKRKLYAFAMTLSYSRMVFLRFFMSMKTRDFQQGFTEAFEFFDGVPRKILIDNLKSGVAERAGTLVRFNDSFLLLARHYAFEPCAANVRRGNEKGRVERTIRYVRDSFFSARRYDSLEDLNAQALAWCQTVASERNWPQDRSLPLMQAFEKERQQLIPLPAVPFPCLERVLVKVSKQAFVYYEGNEYSVPPAYTGRQVELSASEHEIKIYGDDPGVPLAIHVRSYQRGGVIQVPGHEKAILERKPGAKRHAGLARLIALVPEAEDFIAALAERGEHMGGAVAALLKKIDIHGPQAVAQALAEVRSSGSSTLRAVNYVLNRMERERIDDSRCSALETPAVTRFGDLYVKPHPPKTYDDALGVNHDNTR
jgi:transposase